MTKTQEIWWRMARGEGVTEARARIQRAMYSTLRNSNAILTRMSKALKN